MRKIQIPPFLNPGEKIGIVAPASVIRYDDAIPGITMMREQWGLEVVEGATLRSASHQFSASDKMRLHDVQSMMDDPSIRAIIAARGGYGCSRIVDLLNFEKFREAPKWIVGFSDLTALLARTSMEGFASLHGPMVKSMMLDGAAQAAESLKQFLFGKLPCYQIPAHPLNRLGETKGELTGGNLCLLAHMIGSATDINTEGKILFIEDVGEYYYNLDRMMIQLKRAGKLERLAGLLVGQFSDMKDNAKPTFGKDAYQIVNEHVEHYQYPVCFNFPVGHVADNRAMGVGFSATLRVQANKVDLSFSNTYI
jgi:muramoyltetrapeptide carboxypeptidase